MWRPRSFFQLAFHTVVQPFGGIALCATLLNAVPVGAQTSPIKKESSVDLPRVSLLVSEEITDDLQLRPLPPETRGVLRFLENELSIKFELKRQPWKRALDKAMAGDGMIFGVSKTAERLKVLNFSEPLFEDHIWLVCRCDSMFPFRSLQDLKGKTIGVVRGASSGEEFDAQANRLFRIEDDTGATQGRFTKLYQGRMHALVFYKTNTTPQRLADELNRLYAPPSNTKAFCVLPQAITATSIHIGIAKNLDQSLIRRINQAVINGRKNGSLQKMMKLEQDLQ